MIDIPPDTALVADTPRLRLLPLTSADARDLFEVFDDLDLYRFIGGRPSTEQELAARFRRWEPRRSPEGDQLWLNWVVRLVPLGEAVGHMQATVTDDGRANVAWVIGMRWSGNGFATEAGHAMVRVLESHAGVSLLEAHIARDHAASVAVARHLGLHATGRHDDDGEEVWEGSCGVHPSFESDATSEQRGASGHTIGTSDGSS